MRVQAALRVAARAAGRRRNNRGGSVPAASAPPHLRPHPISGVDGRASGTHTNAIVACHFQRRRARGPRDCQPARTFYRAIAIRGRQQAARRRLAEPIPMCNSQNLGLLVLLDSATERHNAREAAARVWEGRGGLLHAARQLEAAWAAWPPEEPVSPSLQAAPLDQAVVTCRGRAAACTGVWAGGTQAPLSGSSAPRPTHCCISPYIFPYVQRQ